jgi:MarR family
MSPQTSPGSSLRDVLAAVAAAPGGTTVADLARTTGIEDDVVRVALHQLVQLGLLGSSSVALSCADGGCGSCPSSTGACGTASGSSLVTLTLTRRDALPPHV